MTCSTSCSGLHVSSAIGWGQLRHSHRGLAAAVAARPRRRLRLPTLAGPAPADEPLQPGEGGSDLLVPQPKKPSKLEPSFWLSREDALEAQLKVQGQGSQCDLNKCRGGAAPPSALVRPRAHNKSCRMGRHSQVCCCLRIPVRSVSRGSSGTYHFVVQAYTVMSPNPSR